MSYEKPQKRNPHALAVFQHSFPAASIARFAGNDGRVDLYLIRQNKQIRVKLDDQLFCAKRTWDQRAESGYMKEIEDKYQQLAESVISGRIKTVNKDDQRTVTDMYAIWNIRGHRKANPIEDQKMGVIDVERHCSKDDQEKLEKEHISVIRSDLTIPGRHLSSGNIQSRLFRVRKQMSDAHWGILRASKGQFIVPDNFSNATILPLSPTICFFSQSDGHVIGEAKVRKINQLALASSRNYYFGNELAKCPK